MRKILVAAMTAGLLALAAPAFADVGGTSEGTNNQVDCGNGSEGTDVGNTGLTIGGVKLAPQTPGTAGALVVCNDGFQVPIQGRVILSGDAGTKSGYVAADGDVSNADQAEGWARVDLSPGAPVIRCGGPTDPGSGTNAENPSGGSLAYCG